MIFNPENYKLSPDQIRDRFAFLEERDSVKKCAARKIITILRDNHITVLEAEEILEAIKRNVILRTKKREISDLYDGNGQ